jgi:hypothetical protein
VAFIDANRARRSGGLVWGVEPICKVLQAGYEVGAGGRKVEGDEGTGGMADDVGVSEAEVVEDRRGVRGVVGECEARRWGDDAVSGAS